jgi:hypothetical protein
MNIINRYLFLLVWENNTQPHKLLTIVVYKMRTFEMRFIF